MAAAALNEEGEFDNGAQDARVVREEEEDTGAAGQHRLLTTDELLPSAALAASKCYRWLEEIDTDVLRTCPADPADIAPSSAADREGSSSTDACSSSGSNGSGAERENSISEGQTLGMDGKYSNLSTLGTVSVASSPSLGFTLAENDRILLEGVSGEGAGGTPPSAADASSAERVAPAEIRLIGNAGGGMREKLRRVLRAFAMYNPRVSYCQVKKGDSIVVGV